MIDVNNWLPIGSVVHIEGYGEDLAMITACMVGMEGDGSLWDYAGVPYPEGITGPGSEVLFNRDAIDGLFHIGYQCPDGERYQDLLRAAEDKFDELKRS